MTELNFENARKGRIETAFEIEAPIERVFKAFSDAEDLRVWLKDDYDVDAREGGSFRFGGNDIGGERHGVFEVVRPPHLLVFSWKWNMHDEASGKQLPSVTDKNPTKVTVTLKRNGNATAVELVHDGFQKADEDYWAYCLGWTMVGAIGLKYYLEHDSAQYEKWWDDASPKLHADFGEDLKRAMEWMSHEYKA